jgi:hypothetical protein
MSAGQLAECKAMPCNRKFVTARVVGDLSVYRSGVRSIRSCPPSPVDLGHHGPPNADQRRWFNAFLTTAKQYIVPVTSIRFSCREAAPERSIKAWRCSFEKVARVKHPTLREVTASPRPEQKSSTAGLSDSFGLPSSTHFSKPCLLKQAQFSSSV